MNYGFTPCWKDMGAGIRCRKPKGHDDECIGSRPDTYPEVAGAPTSFGPEMATWSPAGTKIWQKVWRAVQEGKELKLTEQEVNRLSGMLWHLGVFE